MLSYIALYLIRYVFYHRINTRIAVLLYLYILKNYCIVVYISYLIRHLYMYLFNIGKRSCSRFSIGFIESNLFFLLMMFLFSNFLIFTFKPTLIALLFLSLLLLPLLLFKIIFFLRYVIFTKQLIIICKEKPKKISW